MVSEDLTQEVFIKILKYKSSYKKGNFVSWMYTIARNIFSDYYQKQKRERTSLLEENQIDFNQISSIDNKKEELAYLQTCLQELTVSERELIVMHKVQGIKYQQISEIIGSSENAVKVKTHRVLKKLRDIYFNKNKINN